MTITIDNSSNASDPLACQGQSMSFKDELAGLINKYSKENESDTPDFILAMYISDCLDTFSNVVIRRDKWYGFKTLSKEAQ